jgi:NADH:ubiquinone oxidoreductase subunit 5 (subunit L)/multisubunit Na+/H+ antiporter MnhA subunit
LPKKPLPVPALVEIVVRIGCLKRFLKNVARAVALATAAASMRMFHKVFVGLNRNALDADAREHAHGSPGSMSTRRWGSDGPQVLPGD